MALLLVAAPATAVVLAIRAARARYRSGRIAVVVSGLLLLATLVLTLLSGRIGLVVLAVVTVLVFVGTRCGGPDEEVAPRVGDRFQTVTCNHGPSFQVPEQWRRQAAVLLHLRAVDWEPLYSSTAKKSERIAAATIRSSSTSATC